MVLGRKKDGALDPLRGGKEGGRSGILWVSNEGKSVEGRVSREISDRGVKKNAATQRESTTWN